MPTPTVITDLDPVAANNFPAGSNAPSVLDDVQRAHAAFIRQLLNATQTQAYTAFTTGGTTTAYTLTPSPAIAALAAGQRFRVKFNAANTSTTPTLAVSGLAATAIKVYDATGAKVIPSIGGLALNMLADVEYDGTDYVVLTQLPAPVPYLALGGCTMSTAGSSATMSIAAGRAADSTGSVLMSLSAIAKTTSAWAVGTAQGGLDTGTIANSTWYHFYVIRRPDTGVVDAVFSTNATTPTLPANYTQYRRIGSGRTNGSAQWVSFAQLGDTFLWTAGVLDIDSAAFVAASTLYTMSVPLGIKTTVLMQGFKTGVAGMVNIWSPDIGAVGASTTITPLGVLYTDGSSPTSINQFSARSNTSSQVYGGATAGSQVVKIVTLGWVDSRGKDA